VTPVSETEARLSVPAHAAGRVDIQVGNAAGLSNVLGGSLEYAGPPAISGFTQKRKKWRPKAGTKFSFELDEAAIAKLSFEAHPPGRKVKCRRGTAGKRCRFFASISLDAQAGLSTIPLHGRIPGTREKLEPGLYWVTLRATNSFEETVASKPLRFRILK
jgi:hypothetical protein